MDLGFAFQVDLQPFLSYRRSGESCLSKDQKKTPLTSSIEVN